MEKNEIEQINNFELLIKNLPVKKSFFFNEVFLKPYYIDSYKFKPNQIYNSNEVIFKNNKINYFSSFIIAIFLVALVLTNEINPDNYYIGIGGIIYIGSIVLYTKFKKHNIIKIRTNDFVIENDLFNWKEIYHYGLYINFSSIGKFHSLYIFSLDKGFREFDLSGFHQNEIIKTMNFFNNKNNSKKIIS